MADQEMIESRSPGSAIFLRDKLITFEAWLFTYRRILLRGSGTVVAYAIGLAERALWHIWLFHEDGQPSCIDFTTMWLSGIFATSSDPARIYDDPSVNMRSVFLLSPSAG